MLRICKFGENIHIQKCDKVKCKDGFVNQNLLILLTQRKAIETLSLLQLKYRICKILIPEWEKDNIPGNYFYASDMNLLLPTKCKGKKGGKKLE